MTQQEASKRAGGRRRYNKIRQEQASIRRIQAMELLDAGKTVPEVSALLAVSLSTAYRDLARLRGAGVVGTCPACHRPLARKL